MVGRAIGLGLAFYRDFRGILGGFSGFYGMVIVSGFTLYTSVNFSVHFADFQNKVVGKNYTLVFFSFRLFRIVYGKLVFSIIALFSSSI